jgi:putative transposase
MKKSRFSEFQIISALQRQERGEKARDICREIGISEPTFYNWKSKYGGMSASDLRQLKDLQTENARLKRMFADLSLVHEALKETVAKKL